MEDFETIKKIEALGWADKYIAYIRLREKGLKKEAHLALNDFFKLFHAQDKEARRHFVDLVFTVEFYANNSALYLPYNLYNDVLLPEIAAWKKEEIDNPIPYKWSNALDDYKKALELSPKDQVLLAKVSNYLTGKISMNQHEIDYGYGYDGNPDEDIALIDFFYPFVQHLSDNDVQKRLSVTLTELKHCALVYKSRSNE